MFAAYGIRARRASAPPLDANLGDWQPAGEAPAAAEDGDEADTRPPL